MDCKMPILINSFYKVPIEPNSLIVIDIDETILKYDGICRRWWKERYDYHFCIYKNHDVADKMCENEWKNHIKVNFPSHTDREGFFDLIERAKKLNCKVILVTARDLQIKDITHEHLNYLDITGIEVYFSAGGNKAHVIENTIKENNEKYNDIIFIDDMDHNLRDVNEYFEDLVTCYKFDNEHTC